MDSYGLLKIISWIALFCWFGVVLSAWESVGFPAAFRWL